MGRGRLLRPGSIAQYGDELGNIVEVHNVVCSHCQKCTDVPSLRKMEEYVDVCRSCMKLICNDCANLMAQGKPCTPWLKQVEFYEARYRLWKDMGLVD